MENPFLAITNLLEESDVVYGLLEHEPVHTSEEAARVRGMSAHTGAKSLLLKTGEAFVVAVLAGSQRLDSKKLKHHLGASDKPRFATPEEVQQHMGCEVGACYPHGSLIGLRTILDANLAEQAMLSFNPGVHNKTLNLDMDDYLAVEQPEVADIAEE